MRELPQYRRLGADESVISPSGRFVLRYDAGGVAVLTDQTTGVVRWRAGEEDRPAVGRLVLGGDETVEVEAPGTHEPVWRSELAVAGAHTLIVTDDGDLELLDGERVRRLNSRTGPIEAVALGDRAPVADITGDRFLLREGKSRRTVVRNPDGTLQISERGKGSGSSYSLIAPIVDWLAQPDTVLTWQILPYGDRKTKELCLLDTDGAVLWREGMGVLTPTLPPARPHAYGAAELPVGGRLRHQSLTSPSGTYTLLHQDDGNLVLYRNAEHRAVWATDTWWAGDGWTDLTEDGELVVRNPCGAPVWRSGTAGSGVRRLVVDDEGGVALLDDDGRAAWAVRTGARGPASVANPGRGSRLRRGQTLRHQSLTSADGGTVLVHRGGRTVLFGEDGRPLWDSSAAAGERAFLALGDDGVLRVHADDGAAVAELAGPGDELVVEPGGAALRHVDGTVVWRNGVSGEETDEPRTVDHSSWIEELNDLAYCVTVIHDVDPDTALRRFGADPSRIVTGTWTDLMERADLEEAGINDRIVAAFPLGPHTLLVEDNGYWGVSTPLPSAGTFAVSCYYCEPIDGHQFIVYRDGQMIADHGYENGDDEVTTPEVRRALAEMDADPQNVRDVAYEHGIELLCRTAGVRPSVADVTGPARITIIET